MSKLVGMFYVEKPQVGRNWPEMKTVIVVIHEILEMLPYGRLLTQPSIIGLNGSDSERCNVIYERHNGLAVHSVTELPTALHHAPDYSYQLLKAAEFMSSLVECNPYVLHNILDPKLAAAIARSKLRLKSES